MSLTSVVIIKTRVITGKVVGHVLHARFQHDQHGIIHAVKCLLTTDRHVDVDSVFYFTDIEAAKKTYIVIHASMLDQNPPEEYEGQIEAPEWLGLYDLNSFWLRSYDMKRNYELVSR